MAHIGVPDITTLKEATGEENLVNSDTIRLFTTGEENSVNYDTIRLFKPLLEF